MKYRKALIFLSLLAFLAFTPLRLAAQADSLDRYRGLDSLLTQFYAALEMEMLETKYTEFDSLIESCTDSLVRQHVTFRIFDHYRYSRVMGEEAVAIHVFDKWVNTGKVKKRGEFEHMMDEMFVEFNRNSLLGMKAVPVTLYKPGGAKITVPRENKITVLFFYDTNCAKCRLEWQFLPELLKNVDFPMDFCAVNTGDNRKEWNKFRKSLKSSNRNVKLYHLWDPEMDSNYQKSYAVIGTPRIFLIKEDGEIIGRRLEITNLQEMIQYISISNEKTH